MLLALVAVLAACSAGYRLQRSNGVETLYRVDKNGRATVVYVVNENGTVTVLDENDPVAKRYLANYQVQQQVETYLDKLQAQKKDRDKSNEAADQLRIRRIKAAPKRGDLDPIFVMVHEPALGPKMAGNAKDAKQTRQRMQKFIAEKINADQTIRVTSRMADVDIFPQSYFAETRAFNTQTRRMVKVKAFHFKVDIQSKYLPEDHYIIEESGHWFENEQVILRATLRAGKIIRTMIGPNIPAERYKYL